MLTDGPQTDARVMDILIDHLGAFGSSELKTEKNKELSFFQTLRCCIYHANKCLNANNCWHFNIYEHDKFHAQLS